jgi:hypothetical protein
MIRTGYFGSGCTLHQVKLALPLSSRRMYATITKNGWVMGGSAWVMGGSAWVPG